VKFHSAQYAKEALNKLIPFMVRQAHHERNQTLAVRPELVEGLVQRSPKAIAPYALSSSLRQASWISYKYFLISGCIEQEKPSKNRVREEITLILAKFVP
jgi:hypothetical protein